MNILELRKVVWIPAAILGSALVVGLLLLGWTNGRNKDANTITVTGSVKQRVQSDLGKWNASFSRRAGLSNVKEVLTQSSRDADAVKKFIVAHGLPESSITFLPVATEQVYYYDRDGGSSSVVGYTIRSEVRVESADIAKVEQLSKDLTQLVDQGIIADYQNVQYLYTKLDELRPQLFAEATKDAKTRAEAIASGTGNKVGGLRSARTGVIQVLSPNSTDVSDYGSYDLSTKEKEVSATVSVSFELR